MSKKLTWNEIEEAYPNQWVELVDFEWDEFEPDPLSGVVRRQAKGRKGLHEDFMKNPLDNSAIVYTGTMNIPEGAVFSANLHQYGVNE